MRRIIPAYIVLFVWINWTGVARAELEPATRDGAFRRDVEQRLCFAGRFRFEQFLHDRVVSVARCLEQVASCDGHPNSSQLEQVTIALSSNDVFIPEIGKTYCLIVTEGSKRGLTVQAFGPDDAATLKEMKALMSSPSAFQNNAIWKKRRALWAKYRTDLGTDENPLLYCEDAALLTILYVKKGNEPFPIRLYRAKTGKSEPIIHAKVIPGVNRISFDNGQFRVWYNGSIELNIDAGGEN